MVSAWGADIEKFAPQLTVSYAFANQREAAFLTATDVVIMNIDGVNWFKDKKNLKYLYDFDHLIIDEYTCFPAGTLVATPNGNKPIEAVAEGDVVCTPFGDRPVRNTMARVYVGDLITLTLSNNGAVTCTADHQLLTQRGWVPAERVTAEDSLYEDDQLRGLWEDVPSRDVEDSGRETTATVLRQALLSDLENEYARTRSQSTNTRGARKASSSDEATPVHHSGLEPRPGNVRHVASEPQNCSAGQASKSTQRERNGDDTSRSRSSANATDGFFAQLRDLARQAAAWVSDLLQSRLRKPAHQDCDRSGRRVARASSETRAGREEGRTPCGVRVVRVARNEHGSPIDVYNLEVDGVPYYYANGVCVHNCYKHPTSQRSKAVAAIRKFFKYRRMLSGTPNPNSVMELWHPALIVDDGKRLGTSYFKLRSAVQTPIQVGPSAQHVRWEDKPGANQAVHELLADITIRHAFQDVMTHVPPNHRHHKSFELSKTAFKAYTRMENDCILAHKDATITAVHAASLRTKLLQIASGAVYDGSEEGSYVVIDRGRYEFIAELIEPIEHSLVFFNWRHQRELLAEEFDKRSITFAIIDGTVKQNERDAIVQRYQAGEYQTLLLHPRTGAHGLTLTAGDTTVFASPIYEADLMKQAIHRVYRGAQDKVTNTIFVEALHTVERSVYERLNGKYERMTDLLDLMASRRT